MNIKRFCAMLLTVLLPMGSAFAVGEEAYTITINGGPSGITTANDGSLIVTDVWENAVWKAGKSGVVRLAGDSGAHDLLGKSIGGNKDGAPRTASFRTPYDIVSYKGGYAVSDTDNHTIRLLASSSVTTIAGTVGTSGFRNGSCKDALFNRPTGLTCDLDGNLYIADTGNHVIRKMDASGAVTVYAGSSEGYSTGTRAQTRMSDPTGLCWYDGKLYVADSGNHRILVMKDDKVTVLAGGVKNRNDANELYGGSYRNGDIKNAGFSNPQGVLASEHGVFVADSGNGAIRQITDTTVTTLWSADAAFSKLYPVSPRGIALIGDTLYVSDTYARIVFNIPVTPPEPAYDDIGRDTSGYAAALEMYRLRIFRGTSGNTFSPDGIMTRGQFVTALGNLHNAIFPDAIIDGDAESFSDVSDGAYYAGAARWGTANGITEGTGKDLYSPDIVVTREMMAVYFYRYASFAGFDMTVDLSVLDAFQDAGQISVWARDAMAWAVKADIFHFTEDGLLAPNNHATRLQTVEFFADFLKLNP